MKFFPKPFFFNFVEILLLVSLTFCVLFPFSPISKSLPSRDSGVFLYTGWRVLNNEVPYLQIWDHKPPVIYYLDAFGLWLSPDSTWGVWVIEMASLSLAAVIGYNIFRRVYGLYAALVISFIWILTGFFLLAGGNLTTEYILPFQFFLLWVFFSAETNGKYGWRGYSIGVASALLFFTRQNAIAIPLAIGVFLFFDRVIRKNFRKLIADIAPILIGGLTVTMLILGYFAIKGAISSFWDIAFLYNFAYADERDTMDRFNALYQGMNQLENIGLAQLAFWGWGLALGLMVFKRSRVHQEFRSFFWMALLALPLELFMVSIGGRPRIPYFLALLPILAIFAGFTIWSIFEFIKKDIPVYAIALLAFLMVFSAGSVGYADYSELSQNLMEPSKGSEIVTYIITHSSPSDYVLMWGAETVYNFAARRASPTRFVYQTPLYNLNNKEAVTEFLKAVLDKKTRLIILRSGDKLSDYRFAYRDNQIGGLMDQVKRNYGKPVKVGDWLVYTYLNQ